MGTEEQEEPEEPGELEEPGNQRNHGTYNTGFRGTRGTARMQGTTRTEGTLHGNWKNHFAKCIHNNATLIRFMIYDFLHEGIYSRRKVSKMHVSSYQVRLSLNFMSTRATEKSLH